MCASHASTATRNVELASRASALCAHCRSSAAHRPSRTKSRASIACCALARPLQADAGGVHRAASARMCVTCAMSHWIPLGDCEAFEAEDGALCLAALPSGACEPYATEWRVSTKCPSRLCSSSPPAPTPPPAWSLHPAPSANGVAPSALAAGSKEERTSRSTPPSALLCMPMPLSLSLSSMSEPAARCDREGPKTRHLKQACQNETASSSGIDTTLLPMCCARAKRVGVSERAQHST